MCTYTHVHTHRRVHVHTCTHTNAHAHAATTGQGLPPTPGHHAGHLGSEKGDSAVPLGLRPMGPRPWRPVYGRARQAGRLPCMLSVLGCEWEDS